MLLAPIGRGLDQGIEEELESLRREGYVRARLDGKLIDLGDTFQVDGSTSHDLDVVVDRIVVRKGIEGRLADSVELTLKRGDGTLLLDTLDDSEPRVFSEKLVSWEYGITLPPLEPRLFSFNSPHGACERCGGLGREQRIDPERLILDEGRSLRQGAMLGFGKRGSVAAATELDTVVRRLGVDPDVPWKALPEDQKQSILFGRATPKARAYPGVIPALQELLERGVEDGES
jgi:excinuclease ABC subunit A